MNILLPLMLLATPIQSLDSVINLPSATITSTFKHNGDFSTQPVAATSVSANFMDANRITEPKNLSLVIPNLMYADYGSKMTSSIYMRGVGSRMDNPSMGLYLDHVPILNKNNYDFDYYDVRKVDVMRGPQGTLYGRNTIAGVIDVHTLSPLQYQGLRIRVGYGNGNTSEANVSYYHKVSEKLGFSFALSHGYSDGFYTNAYNNSSADRMLGERGRFKIQARLSEKWMLENTLSLNFIKQNGFAYALYDEQTGKAADINHNDPCSYDRFGIIDGLTLRYSGDKVRLTSTTSYQYTDDTMILDQDFRPVSLFTLRQSQRESAVTQEIILQPTTSGRWDWITGVFGFYKHNKMEAPVTFKRDGIDELILSNANQGIHTMFPDADLLIREDAFPIESNFILPSYGLSLYHQSTFTVNRWKFIAGLRADYENTGIRYDNAAAIHYRFTMTMPDYKDFSVGMSGRENKAYLELLPRVSVMYDTEIGNIYATVARGYKAGGYNTQIFSDLLQNKMMNGLMADLGVYFEGYEPAYDANNAISYKPEYSWNYEVGGHFNFFEKRLFVDAALFYIDCTDQQLTVFPPGKSSGRLMSNAGRARSCGAELTVEYHYKNLLLSGAYGYTNARFISYNDGHTDYSGNYVPYAPQHTASVTCSYRLVFSDKWLDNLNFNLGWQGVGKIYWNESNTTSQPFYGLMNATVSINKKGYQFGIWGKNLTGTRYDTFYFKSVGNSFVQRGKPIQFGAFFTINL